MKTQDGSSRHQHQLQPIRKQVTCLKYNVTNCICQVRDGNESTLLEAVKQHIEAGNIELLTAVLASEQYKVREYIIDYIM